MIARMNSLLVLALTFVVGGYGLNAANRIPRASGTPPVIDEQPIGRTVTEGGFVALSVLAHATAPMSYQWWKAGQLLTNDTRVSSATNLVLNIDPVQLSDATNYFAVVSSSGGAVTSATVSLVVSQLLVQFTATGTTGAVMTMFGQVGDVYRIEHNVNFSGYTTNGYATNVTGVTQGAAHWNNDGLIHQLRVKLDRMLPVVYPLRASNGTAGFRAYGKLNQAWRCDTSSDLSAWTPLGTVTNSTGWLTFFDPRLTLPPVRFYRIAPPQ
jgi:hypothetical protein